MVEPVSGIYASLNVVCVFHVCLLCACLTYVIIRTVCLYGWVRACMCECSFVLCWVGSHQWMYGTFGWVLLKSYISVHHT